MKPIVTLVLAMVLLAGGSPAQTSGSDFDRLKQGYDAAVQRALAPLRETYRKELEKLLTKAEQAGQLDESLRIKEELGKIIPASGQGAEKAEKPSAEPAATPEKSIERFFVGKTWASGGGTKFSFQKNGTGHREYGGGKWSFTWKQIGPDLIEAFGPRAAGEDDTNWYFRFVSKEEAYYGDSATTTKGLLKPTRP